MNYFKTQKKHRNSQFNKKKTMILLQLPSALFDRKVKNEKKKTFKCTDNKVYITESI